ncbi:flagellar hook protein FlgE [Marivibrio halodurans]|uniref:Flagellar hook protein FlgE n=1 Tax=Marivibrio halodurans TaxID=2039722 RepID=A0A8J7S3N0_9PROT|nr:flagellar hook protein FlgE [Marivibrio halodurans]MBP5856104.1 flagellar hook protein FlgE [Marivibrio halodurans]
MSIFGGLRSGVSGLFVQSQSMAMISDNIANVNTVGYKVNRPQFSTLVTTSGSETLFSAGGVQSTVARDIDQQGLLQASTVSTDIAISGDGFFAVTDQVTLNPVTNEYEPTGDIFYTRAGEFRPDKNGNLVNAAGFTLLGFARNSADTAFNTTNVLSAMDGVNVASQSAKPQPTSLVDLSANLQNSTGTGGSFDIAVQVFDRQGTQRTMTLTFTKVDPGVAADAWDVTAELTAGQFVNTDASNNDGGTGSAIDAGGGSDTADDNYLGSDELEAFQGTETDYSGFAEDVIGTGGIANLGRVTFNTNGTLSSVTDDFGGVANSGVALTGNNSFQVLVDYDGNNTTSTDTVAIDINLGSIGGSDGLSQFSGNSVINDLTQNGKQFGSLSSVSVNEDGVVTALFDNGEQRQLFQVPIVTFNAPNALRPESGNVFSQTDDSGQPVVKTAGNGGAGSIASSSLEQSTVDLADEFTKLIVTQRAFSANTRIITTADEMLEELVRIKR